MVKAHESELGDVMKKIEASEQRISDTEEMLAGHKKLLEEREAKIEKLFVLSHVVSFAFIRFQLAHKLLCSPPDHNGQPSKQQISGNSSSR